MLSENSWVLSLKNSVALKYRHNYFCTCSKEFIRYTEINKPDAPDILCPLCGNDYFKDVFVFENMKSTKIWKAFNWTSIASEDKDCWNILLQYEIPTYDDKTNEIKIINKELLHITLKKDGSNTTKFSYKSKMISTYSLFLDERVQSLKSLLEDEAKESLYNYVMMKRSKEIEWIDDDKLKEFSSDEKLTYLIFFLENSHLKEHQFFFWKMNRILKFTTHYATQVSMLNFIANKRKEKSVKKALYQGYENMINHIGYYPYSDYIFSRTIKNLDLLIKLYGLHPSIKQEIFTDDTFTVAIEFILFLKSHYTEKQIVKLFTQDIQDVKHYKTRLQNWRDTLRMLQSRNAFDSLEEYFIKVKLTTKRLHDEIIRVFHIISYELDAKESFEYDKIYLSACGKFETLDFKLPTTVRELSLWAKILHNCMLGYSRSIHEQRSLIYGVFKAEELLYAVELNNIRIVQAKAIFNKLIPAQDMDTINSWRKKKLVLAK